MIALAIMLAGGQIDRNAYTIEAGGLALTCKGSSRESFVSCANYIGAVSDGLLAQAVQSGKPVMCMTKTTSLWSEVEAFKAYIVKHPERTGENAAPVVIAALVEAFPCPKA